MDEREQEQERADDDGVAVERDVSVRPRRAPHGRRARRQRTRRRPAGEAPAAVRKVGDREHHGRGAGEHQRDQRQVEAREPERRKADERADPARDRPSEEQQERKRQRRRVREPRADPAADGQQRHLAEGDHPDAAVEDAEAERHDRVDRDARRCRDPVGCGDRRHADERDDEHRGDDEGADDRPPLEAGDLAAGRGAVA